MSLELLKNIERAEAKADDARAEAQKEARDMLKSVEEACLTQERNAALEHRALAQRILEDAKTTANRRIKEMDAQDAAERERITGAAQVKLDEAAQRIFERVVNHGDR